jgi:hypothetical protein
MSNGRKCRMTSNWNATTLFNELLSAAENRFGTRSRDLTVQVEARDHKTPETIPSGANGCIVYYFREAESDYQRLRFQLAHEAIHVLSGTLNREALKLEEGLAVWFSLSVMNRQYRKRVEKGDGISRLFLDAFNLFKRLDPNDDKVKRLREKCPALDEAIPELIAEIFAVDIGLASELCQRVPPDMRLR